MNLMFDSWLTLFAYEIDFTLNYVIWLFKLLDLEWFSLFFVCDVWFTATI